MESAATEWREVSKAVTAFHTRLSKSRTVNVNSTSLKQEINSIAQRYLRLARPELVRVGLKEDVLQSLDQAFQELLRLSHGNNYAASYKKWLKNIRALIPKITAGVELHLGAERTDSFSPSFADTQIMETLKAIVPSASLSYRQALFDLSDSSRISFRGPAVELREALREVLDHLAPDADVVKADGFKLEKGRVGPTMRQRVQFILKARGRSKAAMAAPGDAAETVELGVADLARSVYTQGSVVTHVTSSRDEAVRLKRYVEVVLLDLLEL